MVHHQVIKGSFMQFSCNNLVRLFSSGWRLSWGTQWSHQCRQPPENICFSFHLRFGLLIFVLKKVTHVLHVMNSWPPYSMMFSLYLSSGHPTFCCVKASSQVAWFNHSHLFYYTYKSVFFSSFWSQFRILPTQITHTECFCNCPCPPDPTSKYLLLNRNYVNETKGPLRWRNQLNSSFKRLEAIFSGIENGKPGP